LHANPFATIFFDLWSYSAMTWFHYRFPSTDDDMAMLIECDALTAFTEAERSLLVPMARVHRDFIVDAIKFGDVV